MITFKSYILRKHSEVHELDQGEHNGVYIYDKDENLVGSTYSYNEARHTVHKLISQGVEHESQLIWS